MTCKKCSCNDNYGRRYCRDCGAKLGQECTHCGFTNEELDQYCGGCGLSASVANANIVAPELKSKEGHKRFFSQYDTATLDEVISQAAKLKGTLDEKPISTLQQEDIDKLFSE
jgi:hypothetical protein